MNTYTFAVLEPATPIMLSFKVVCYLKVQAESVEHAHEIAKSNVQAGETPVLLPSNEGE